MKAQHIGKKKKMQVWKMNMTVNRHNKRLRRAHRALNRK